MIDVSNALLKESTNWVAAPEVPALLSAPPLKLAPAVVLPATPDISADVTLTSS
jgi:hypothetical protein